MESSLEGRGFGIQTNPEVKSYNPLSFQWIILENAMDIVKKDTKGQAKGFTLIELMVVVAILGVLGLIVAQNVLPYFTESQQTVAKTNIATLKSAVTTFKLKNFRYPSSLDELLQPDEKFNNEPYLENEEALIDPWGNAYYYNPIGADGKFEIISYGEDGVEGGEGPAADISSRGEKKNLGF
jgi:general secretion pathway protein G